MCGHPASVHVFDESAAMSSIVSLCMPLLTALCLAASAHAADYAGPLFDAHLHYNEEAFQPHPLPERMIEGCAREYLHTKLGRWGANGLAHVEPEALAEYERNFCTPEAIHGACEDYRASAGIDLDHDRAARERGERIACDMLVLWGERGLVHRLFDPPALWRAQCSATVESRLMPSGHYIPEELPDATAQALHRFFLPE
jgi:haloacetate dehalogenase